MQPFHRRCELGLVRNQIKAAFGRDLLALFRDKADFLGPNAQSNIDNLRRVAHLEIQLRHHVVAQALEITIEHVPTIERLHVAGIRVSLFVDPTLEQIDAAGTLGVEMVELHTGKLANAFAEKIQNEELNNLQAAAKAAAELKLQVNAGHGINYENIALVRQIPQLSELNIGHSIIARAIFIGLEDAVREMLRAMELYKG